MYYVNTPQTFADVVALFIDLLSMLIPIIFTLAFLVILWKVIDTWILHGDDASKVDEGKKFVTVGIVGLVIMSGIWGILRLLRATLLGY